jgi:hypothetical protein
MNLFDEIRAQQPDAVLQDEINSKSCEENGVKLKINLENNLLILKGEHIKNHDKEILQHVFGYKICDRIIWIDESRSFIAIVEMKKGYTKHVSALLEKFENGITEAKNILEKFDENINSYRWGFFLIYVNIPGLIFTELGQKPLSIFGRKVKICRCKQENSYFEINSEYLFNEYKLHLVKK